MFDDRLKKLRISKQLNMKQAAKMLNMPYTTYIGYEKNTREPNSDALILLADFFDCSIDYLVGRSERVKVKLLDDNLEKTDTNLTNHEKTVITAYRQQPEMRPAVDRVLGISGYSQVLSMTAARTNTNEQSIKQEHIQDLSKYEPDKPDF